MNAIYRRLNNEQRFRWRCIQEKLETFFFPELLALNILSIEMYVVPILKANESEWIIFFFLCIHSYENVGRWRDYITRLPLYQFVLKIRTYCVFLRFIYTVMVLCLFCELSWQLAHCQRQYFPNILKYIICTLLLLLFHWYFIRLLLYFVCHYTHFLPDTHTHNGTYAKNFFRKSKHIDTKFKV